MLSLFFVCNVSGKTAGDDAGGLHTNQKAAVNRFCHLTVQFPVAVQLGGADFRVRRRFKWFVSTGYVAATRANVDVVD